MQYVYTEWRAVFEYPTAVKTPYCQSAFIKA